MDNVGADARHILAHRSEERFANEALERNYIMLFMATGTKLLPIPRRFDAKGVQRYGFRGLSYA